MQTSNVIVMGFGAGAAVAAFFVDRLSAAIAQYFERRHERQARERAERCCA
jgi:acetyl esterase/lipase